MKLFHVFLFTMFCISISCNEPRKIIQKVGSLYFTEAQWEIQFELNTTEYVATGDILNEYIDKLGEICKQINRTTCDTFSKNAGKFKSNVKRDMVNIGELLRVKRFLFGGGYMIVSLLEMVDSSFKSSSELKRELQLSLKTFEKSVNASIQLTKQFNVTINEIEGALIKMGDSHNKLNDKVELYKTMDEILHSISWLMLNHGRVRQEILQLFSGNTKGQIFSIINFEKFMQILSSVNETLNDGQMLPTINFGNLEFIKSDMKRKNDTHLVLSVRIPILNKKPYDIYEIIPIPFKIENNYFIFNISTTRVIQNKKGLSKILTNEASKYCISAQNITVCNTLIDLIVEPISNCTNALFYNGSDRDCILKPIKAQNYIVQINKDELYFSIKDAIKLRMVCTGNEEIINITSSRKIKISDTCVAYKYTQGLNITNDMISFLNEDKHYLHPNMFIFSNVTKIWKNENAILTKFDIQNIQLTNTLKNISKDLPTQILRINNINITKGPIENFLDGGIFSNFFSGIRDAISAFFIYLLIGMLVFAILKLCLGKGLIFFCKLCFKRDKKRNTSNTA